MLLQANIIFFLYLLSNILAGTPTCILIISLFQMSTAVIWSNCTVQSSHCKPGKPWKSATSRNLEIYKTGFFWTSSCRVGQPIVCRKVYSEQDYFIVLLCSKWINFIVPYQSDRDMTLRMTKSRMIGRAGLGKGLSAIFLKNCQVLGCFTPKAFYEFTTLFLIFTGCVQ